MANKELIKLLTGGSSGWNQWLEHNPAIDTWNDWRRSWLGRPDLSGAQLGGAVLDTALLVDADLASADLSETDLRRADLQGADLRGANLRHSNLGGAILVGANLSEADLSNADLSYVDFREANLSGATLRESRLYKSVFTATDLQAADFQGAKLWEVIFADTDLGCAKGLDCCIHEGPCAIDNRTLTKSKALPLRFLRGCGLPENLIEYLPSLMNANTQFYSCFISYSAKDQEFAERLYADLQDNGIRCWFAPKDLPIGSETRSGIDKAIRSHDKLLVVLSQNSVRSPWVKKEVETAFEKESQESRIVLFPIRLDDEVMCTNTAWAADIRRMRNIGDFQDWKNQSSYKKALARLLRDLKAERQAGAAAQK